MTPLFGSLLKAQGDPCAGAPNITGVTVAFQSAGSCPSTPATWRVTVTLDGSLGSNWEVKMYICVQASTGCTPGINFYTGTSLQQDYSHSNHEGNSGSGETTWYANAKAEVVPVGQSDVCDTDSATEASRNPYRGCFD